MRAFKLCKLVAWNLLFFLGLLLRGSISEAKNEKSDFGLRSFRGCDFYRNNFEMRNQFKIRLIRVTPPDAATIAGSARNCKL